LGWKKKRKLRSFFLFPYHRPKREKHELKKKKKKNG